MDSRIGVLIADDNEDFGNLLKDYLGHDESLNIVGVARDGRQALEMIREYLPDIVILDIIMPVMDGIGVLEEIARPDWEIKPFFIVLSAIGQESYVRKAIALGAEYYMVKPFDVNSLIRRIKQIYADRHDGLIEQYANISSHVVKERDTAIDMEVKVTGLMHQMNLPPHMIGYQHLREAILMTIEDSRMFSPVTRILYPAIAAKYGTTPKKVERAIRNVIECAWTRLGVNAANTFYGVNAKNGKGKPTNSQFIAMMADKIKVMFKRDKK